MVSYPSNDSITEGFQKVTKSLKKNMEIGSIPDHWERL